MTLTKSLTNYFIERENQWVKARDIRQFYNIGRCSLRRQIQSLRNNGMWIIANSKGYKLTTNSQELREYCDARLKEIYVEEAQIKALRRDTYKVEAYRNCVVGGLYGNKKTSKK